MLTIVKISRVMALEEDIAIDYLFNSMKGISPQYKAIVFADQFNSTSTLVRKISQRANQEFPCTNIGENLGIIGGGINSTRLISEDNGRLLFDFFSLTIYIVEIKNGPHDLTKIADFMKYTISLSQGLRGKFIINIIVQEKINLEPFFWRVLSDGIDDISVIEWISERSTDMDIIQSDGYNVYVNTFNHLNQTFTRSALTSLTKMGLHRIKNFHGYPVKLKVICIVDECEKNCEIHPLSELEKYLFESLIEAMNCSLRTTHMVIGMGVELSLQEEYLIKHDVDMSIPDSSDFLLNSDSRVDLSLSFIRNKITPTPVPLTMRFYFMQEKKYDRGISLAAIIAFAGLFFTAFIFAVWAQFLGFKERNWNFLNILTAQMGGNLEHQGRMKLSEMIFQMSIYIATFIVVTLGTDYMYQIFVIRQSLTEVKTLEDLAELDTNFFIDVSTFLTFYKTERDSTLQKIFNRTKLYDHVEGSHSFCQLPTNGASSNLDESINLCIEDDINMQYIMKSDQRFHITRIDEPIFETILYFKFDKPFLLYKNRLAELITRFSEVGILKIWIKDIARLKAKKTPHVSTIVEEINDEVPLEQQLWPIIAVGSALSIIALFLELVWKRWIEKTQLGYAVKAFYSESRSNSANRALRLRHSTVTLAHFDQGRRGIEIRRRNLLLS
ncbi:hypothetical protein QAD02_011542 [Eretmocerus hayati]|uniref:Uncharacterized protein n=1 Tax=Eretmocerus hayati TaxID=131215 RepID=A0ACC2NX73_9HYME|nr:hypothetical protein QAD02_011542 [Eretmocerus hayati]